MRGLHGVEVRFLPLLQLGQALFQLLSLCIIETVLLSRCDPCVDLFTLRNEEVFLRIFSGSFLSTTCCQNRCASARSLESWLHLRSMGNSWI